MPSNCNGNSPNNLRLETISQLVYSKLRRAELYTESSKRSYLQQTHTHCFDTSPWVRRIYQKQSTHNVIFRRVRATIFAIRNTISIRYAECVFVALVIRRAKRIRRVILQPVASLALPCFSPIASKMVRFSEGRGKYRTKYVLSIFSTTYDWNIFYYTNN
jgi:hypothetical protein